MERNGQLIHHLAQRLFSVQMKIIGRCCFTSEILIVNNIPAIRLTLNVQRILKKTLRMSCAVETHAVNAEICALLPSWMLTNDEGTSFEERSINDKNHFLNCGVIKGDSHNF